jgi:hypothetical protein
MSDLSRHLDELQEGVARGLKVRSTPGVEGPIITAPGWEPIGDQHKTGILVLAVHKYDPENPRLVRWDPDAVFDPNNPGMKAPDAFTHAYIFPPFEPV